MSNTPQNNCLYSTIILLKLLGVSVSKTSIKEKLSLHPDYPSLLSISDALSSWKIENKTARITKDNLHKLKVPFLTPVDILPEDNKQTNGNTSDKIAEKLFVVVKHITPDTVTYSETHGSNRWTTVSKNNFDKIWNGIVLVAEPGKDSGEREFNMTRRKELFSIMVKVSACLIPAILFCFAITNFFKPTTTTSISHTAIILIKLLGTSITALLLYREVDSQNQFLRSVCSASPKLDCNAILDSKASKLLGVISWSEIGFMYFSGTFFVLLIKNTSGGLFNIYALINLLAVPYTIFSIVYQWRIAKQWCILCLSVQALLLVELIIFWGSGNYLLFSQIEWNTIIIFGCLFPIPLIFWLLIKDHIIESKAAKQTRVELVRLKNNISIFDILLTREDPIIPADGLGITLGNIKGKYSIIKVCNPYCAPCSEAHTVLEDIISTNDDVSVQIIYKATNSDFDPRSKPVSHLLAIAKSDDYARLKKAMNEWYGSDEKNYDRFKEKYPLQIEPIATQETINKMADWCNKMRISSTPTIFVNGHALPDIYSISDLKYLLSN